MYIPEFVCGIGFTLITEVVLLVAWSIYDSRKKKRK